MHFFGPHGIYWTSSLCNSMHPTYQLQRTQLIIMSIFCIRHFYSAQVYLINVSDPSASIFSIL